MPGAAVGVWLVGFLLAGSPAWALAEPAPRAAGLGGVHAGNLAWVCQRALDPCTTETSLQFQSCHQLPFLPQATLSVAGGAVLVHVGAGTLYPVTEYLLGLSGGVRIEGGTLVGMYCRFDLPHEVIVYGQGVFLQD